MVIRPGDREHQSRHAAGGGGQGQRKGHICPVSCLHLPKLACFTTLSTDAFKLMESCTSVLSIQYWNKVIPILQDDYLDLLE